jgi:hypothetical protein
MRPPGDRVYEWKGHLCIPFSSVPLAGGPFLPASLHFVARHLVLAPGFQFGLKDRFVGGIARARPALVAARLHGDSMIGAGFADGDIVIFQREEYGDLDRERIAVIEKSGEEENYGSWALKKIIVEKPRLARRDEYGENRDWNDPIIQLYSYNGKVSPWRLDPSGQHRIHGVFRRTVPAREACFEDSEVIRRQSVSQE